MIRAFSPRPQPHSPDAGLEGKRASIVSEWVDRRCRMPTKSRGSRRLVRDSSRSFDSDLRRMVGLRSQRRRSRSGTALKGQGGADNEVNKREAIGHAAYRSAKFAPQQRRALTERMKSAAMIRTPPPLRMVGRRAAIAVLAECRQDGANEASDFADTTGYQPGTTRAPGTWRPIELFGKAATSDDPAMEPRHALLAGARRRIPPHSAAGPRIRRMVAADRRVDQDERRAVRQREGGRRNIGGFLPWLPRRN